MSIQEAIQNLAHPERGYTRVRDSLMIAGLSDGEATQRADDWLMTVNEPIPVPALSEDENEDCFDGIR